MRNLIWLCLGVVCLAAPAVAGAEGALIVNNGVELYDSADGNRPVTVMFTGARVDVIDESENGERLKVKLGRGDVVGWVERDNVRPITTRYQARSQTVEPRDVQTNPVQPGDEVRLVFRGEIPEYRVFQLRGDCHRNAYIYVDIEADELPRTWLGERPLVRVESIEYYAGGDANSTDVAMLRMRFPIQTKDPVALDWREDGHTLTLIIGHTDRLGAGREFPREVEERNCY